MSFREKMEINIEQIKKYLFAIGIIFVISLLAESLIFNYKFFFTLFNKPYVAELKYDTAFQQNNDGSVTVVEGERNIYVENVNRKLTTAKIEYLPSNDQDMDVVTYFGATDYSHEYDSHLNGRTIYTGEERSKYISFHLYGDCKTLRISPQLNMEQTLNIKVTINPRIPFFFQIDRVLFVFFILCVVYFLKSASALHELKYVEWKGISKKLFITLYVIANIALFLWMVKLNPYYQHEAGANFAQYQELTEAFLKGQLHILEEPPQSLIDLNNPYDAEARQKAMEEAGTGYLFDHAYYNGHYYVYFGVVPVVLIYLPYYLITGQHIHNNIVIFIGMVLLFLAILLVMDQLIKKFSRKCSVAIWFLATEFIIMGCNMLYILKRPDFYSVPNTFGLMFGMWGLGFFLKAYKNEKAGEELTQKKINNVWIILGSLSTALICGCRPQIFVFIVLDIIILRKYIFDLNFIKEKNGIRFLLSAIIPMVIVASLLMTYNALRFGSPFDFGANYNLTFNDMRNRGWNLDRIPLGIMVYLLRPMNIYTEFPYFGNVYVDPKYMGVTIQETTYGGVLWAYPFAFIGFLPILFRRFFNKKNTLWILNATSLILALIVVIVDTEMSGLLARYFADFSIFIMLAGVMATLMISTRNDVKGSYLYNVFVTVLLCFFVFECFYHINVFMLDSGDYLKYNRKDLYYHIYYLVSFAM